MVVDLRIYIRVSMHLKAPSATRFRSFLLPYFRFSSVFVYAYAAFYFYARSNMSGTLQVCFKIEMLYLDEIATLICITSTDCAVFWLYPNCCVS